jgi:hypothetical protein
VDLEDLKVVKIRENLPNLDLVVDVDLEDLKVVKIRENLPNLDLVVDVDLEDLKVVKIRENLPNLDLIVVDLKEICLLVVNQNIAHVGKDIEEFRVQNYIQKVLVKNTALINTALEETKN